MSYKNILIICFLMWVCCVSPVTAQDSPSIDPEREVIVMFQPGQVTPPVSRVSGQTDEFSQ
ncbi:MAG: hypothetical protein B6244_13715 [Candidatus Cloacimonetes bacterium 4572_55]|nr:MAG: hypothetical protein B6244_13715 [Candidatus Cloacimonetes bacterium 4572_55]